MIRNNLTLTAAGAVCALLATTWTAYGQTGSSELAGQAFCDDFPGGDIRVVVPLDPGGGFDAWARLFSPYLSKHLEGNPNVRVENIAGGGGMRGVNTVYSASPDGRTLLFTEPGYVIANQITGDVLNDFDVNRFQWLGGVTKDIDVFYVGIESDMEGFEDVRGRTIRHANQQTQPHEVILYEVLGVNASYILHDGTADVILSVRRGDSDASRGSLSSIFSYIESGVIKPIGILGVDPVTPEYPAYEHLVGLDTLETIGQESLASAFDYRRLLGAPPETAPCVAEPLERALMDTLEDPEFLAAAKAANLVVVPATAEQAAAHVSNSVIVLDEYKDAILSGL